MIALICFHNQRLYHAETTQRGSETLYLLYLQTTNILLIKSLIIMLFIKFKQKNYQLLTIYLIRIYL